MKPLFILISSDLPQQGKDTCAKFIQNSLKMYSNIESKTCSFADALKKYVHEKYNIDEERLKIDPAYKEEIRPLYIKEGDGARLYDSFVWCKKLLEAIMPFIKAVNIEIGDIPVIIIPDNRYLNEYDFFREKFLCGIDAFVWNIHIITNKSAMIDRFGKDRFEKLASTLMSRSQRELNTAFGIEFNSILSNNGTLDEFNLKTHTETSIIINNYIRSIDK
jgi:hypothetical protein